MIPVGELFEQKMTLVHFVPFKELSDTLQSKGERKGTPFLGDFGGFLGTAVIGDS